jgi:hypothetical protein
MTAVETAVIIAGSATRLLGALVSLAGISGVDGISEALSLTLTAQL